MALARLSHFWISAQGDVTVSKPKRTFGALQTVKWSSVVVGARRHEAPPWHRTLIQTLSLIDASLTGESSESHTSDLSCEVNVSVEGENCANPDVAVSGV